MLKKKKNIKFILLFAYSSSAVISFIFFIPVLFANNVSQSFFALFELFKFEAGWLTLNIIISIYAAILMILKKAPCSQIGALSIVSIIFAVAGVAVFGNFFLQTGNYGSNGLVILLLSLNHLFLFKSLRMMRKNT